MKKDTLHKPIEYICATYSDEGLQNLLKVLNDWNNIAAVADELSMRIIMDQAITAVEEEEKDVLEALAKANGASDKWKFKGE